MARKSHEEVVASGILTPSVAAVFLHITTPTVHRLIDNGDLDCFRVPGSRDKKIPALEVYYKAKNAGFPIHVDLAKAADNFRRDFPEASSEIDEKHKENGDTKNQKTKSQTQAEKLQTEEATKETGEPQGEHFTL